MKQTIAKTLTAAAATTLLLSGCGLLDRGGDTSGGTNGDDGGSDNPVYAEMASWNACEVLDNLQPITDFMGIEGYGSSTATGGEPGNSEIGNTFDPDAMGCNGLINLGDNDGSTASGELQVKIIPTESEEQATTTYEDRVTSAETESAQWTDAQSEEFGDPWDQGTVVSWIGDAEQPTTEVIARDGQWVFHIQLYHTTDFGVRNGGEPAFQFTEEELRQWFVANYLPEVNQAINDRIAEVQ
jgi:hypothetical protein